MHNLGYYLNKFFSSETEKQQELCWSIINKIVEDEK